VVEATRLTSLNVPALSPALRQPLTTAPLLTALGDNENQGFHTQFDAIRESWRHVHAGHVTCPGLDHFTILEALTQPDGAIALAALRLMQSFDAMNAVSTSNPTPIPPAAS
jgi:arylformamidase